MLAEHGLSMPYLCCTVLASASYMSQVMSQVMSTSPSLSYHTNCLYAPNAAAEETVSLPANVLLKLAFLNAGVKEMLTIMYIQIG